MTTQTSKAPSTSPDRPPAARRADLPEVPTWRRRLRPYLLSVPAVVIVIGILYPFAVGAYYAFLNYAAVNPDPHLVWFDNFASVLGDQVFWKSVQVTVTFAVAATFIETVLGVGLALLLNRSSIIGKIFERVLILPLMIAPVIAGVIWKLMFNPQFGVLNHVLGLGNTFDWLSARNALFSVILVDIWIFTPFVAILVLAGFVGFAVISKVPNTLHTPLMSGTNAIHGIVVLGALVVLGKLPADAGGGVRIIAFVALVFGTLNVVGGFAVTERMLAMYKKKEKKA